MKIAIQSTLGQRALESTRELRKLCDAGTDWVRINMSHTKHEDAEDIVGWLRRSAPQVKVLLDLQGPKLRVGKMAREQRIRPGDNVVFCTQALYNSAPPRDRDAQRLVPIASPFPFANLFSAELFRLKDGQVEFTIERRIPEQDVLICEAKGSGMIRSEKGLNAPGIDRTGAPLPAKDLADIALGQRLGVDAICCSFVTTGAELVEARAHVAKLAPEWKPQLWAKVECREAMEHLDGILAACDAVLIGRGDLAGELGGDPELVHAAAMQIAKHVVAAGKPCSVGTKLLESMRASPEPSDEEIAALYDYLKAGVTGYLLTAETSVGDYPVEAIQTLRRFADGV